MEAVLQVKTQYEGVVGRVREERRREREEERRRWEEERRRWEEELEALRKTGSRNGEIHTHTHTHTHKHTHTQ